MRQGELQSCRLWGRGLASKLMNQSPIYTSIMLLVPLRAALCSTTMCSTFGFRLSLTSQGEMDQILKLLHLFMGKNDDPISLNLLKPIRFQWDCSNKRTTLQIYKLCSAINCRVPDHWGYISRSKSLQSPNRNVAFFKVTWKPFCRRCGLPRANDKSHVQPYW